MIQVFAMDSSKDLITRYHLSELTQLGHNTLLESFFFTALHTSLAYGPEKAKLKIKEELVGLLNNTIDLVNKDKVSLLLLDQPLQAVGHRLIDDLNHVLEEHTIESYRVGSGKLTNVMILDIDYEC